MDIQFNEQQLEAIEQIGQWFPRASYGRSDQVYFLSGYAGTGKTTTARQAAANAVGHNQINMVEFIAPTGKAAARLREKGCKGARTMHQFIYRVLGEDDDGDPVFSARGKLDYKPRLIVIDECSMIGTWDLNNIKKHNIPILAIGDIGQLPPVSATPAFIAGSQNYLLDKIERQGGESNIIRASMFIRQGHKLPPREYEDVRVRFGDAPLQELVNHCGEDAQILVARNATRWGINRKVRQALGYHDSIPMIGEKIVCLFNQHGFGIMNGEQGIVVEYKQVEVDDGEEDDVAIYKKDKGDDDDQGHRVVIKSLTDGKLRECRFDYRAFDSDPDVRKEYSKKPGAWDFGYAMTVHKSQGSEWDRVLVIEESIQGIPYNQLMYTAVTRAKNQLTLYRP